MRNSKGSPQYRNNHKYFKTVFPATIKEWNMLDFDIRNSEGHNVFKNKVLKFSRLKASFFFYYLNPKGVKLVTRSQLGLSHFFLIGIHSMQG